MGDADATIGDGSREDSSTRLGWEEDVGLEEQLRLWSNSGTGGDDDGGSISEGVGVRVTVGGNAGRSSEGLWVTPCELEVDAAREMTRW